MNWVDEVWCCKGKVMVYMCLILMVIKWRIDNIFDRIFIGLNIVFMRIVVLKFWLNNKINKVVYNGIVIVFIKILLNVRLIIK